MGTQAYDGGSAIREQIEDETGYSADVPSPVETVPVTVVDAVRVEPLPPRSTTFINYILDGVTEQQVSQDRANLVRRLISCNAVTFLSQSQAGANAGNGFALPANVPIVIEGRGEIWAFSTVVNTRVSVMSEYLDG